MGKTTFLCQAIRSSRNNKILNFYAKRRLMNQKNLAVNIVSKTR